MSSDSTHTGDNDYFAIYQALARQPVHSSWAQPPTASSFVEPSPEPSVEIAPNALGEPEPQPHIPEPSSPARGMSNPPPIPQAPDTRTDSDAMGALAYLMNRHGFVRPPISRQDAWNSEQYSTANEDTPIVPEDDAPSPLESAFSDSETSSQIVDQVLASTRERLTQLEPELTEPEIDNEPGSSGSLQTRIKPGHRSQYWNSLVNTTSLGANSVAKYLGSQLINQTQSLSEAITTHPYVQNATLIASEAARYAADRTRQITEYYTDRVLADDPDLRYYHQAHLAWDTMPTSLTTLTWYERQLIPQTKAVKEEESSSGGSRTRRNTATGGDELVQMQQLAQRGDDDAEFALAKRFAPPDYALHDYCFTCKQPFGPKKYRHHCRHCGQSFCHDHSSKSRQIFKFGYSRSVRVCDACSGILLAEEARDRLLWKGFRVQAFLRGRLIPYFEKGVDRGVDKAVRAVEGAIYLAKKTPLSATASFAVEAVDIVRRYGLAGMAGVLLRQDFMEAVEALKHLSGLGDAWPLSIHELTACIYYMLATERGVRGSQPELEFTEHQNSRHLRQAELHRLLKYGPMALRFLYDRSVVDAQLLARQQGWDTVFICAQSAPEQPAHGLFARGDEKEAVLVIRGTHSIQDVVTDIRAVPVQFPPPIEEIYAALKMTDAASHKTNEHSSAQTSTTSASTIDWRNVTVTEDYACGGMARSAIWLLAEVGPSLVELYNAGYQITIVGHSLGGAVAGLLGIMLKNVCDSIQVISYSTPSCVDERLASLMKGFMTTVILHDDAVPRMTPSSIRMLLKDLMRFRSTVFRYLQNDWQAVASRAVGLWAPRWRDTALLDAQEEAKDANARVEPSGDEIIVDDANNETVLLKEENLPELYIPGTIFHIYSHRGVYKIAQVDTNFPSLRKIVVQGNIFKDHDSDNVYDALCECVDVLNATMQPPQWTPFSEARRCECCGCQFTWNSTFNSEAQENRDRHNCRSCGACVCGPCSTHRVALQEIGLREPSRVCDHCFNKGVAVVMR